MLHGVTRGCDCVLHDESVDWLTLPRLRDGFELALTRTRCRVKFRYQVVVSSLARRYRYLPSSATGNGTPSISFICCRVWPVGATVLGEYVVSTGRHRTSDGGGAVA